MSIPATLIGHEQKLRESLSTSIQAALALPTQVNQGLDKELTGLVESLEAREQALLLPHKGVRVVQANLTAYQVRDVQLARMQAGDGLQQQVVQLLQHRRWAACMCLLQAARSTVSSHSSIGITTPPSSDWLLSREAVQAWLVAGIHHHCEASRWHDALQLQAQAQNPNTPASSSASTQWAASVQQAHRRLSVYIHPDKCALPYASSAFQLATLAKSRLLVSGAGHGDASIVDDQGDDADDHGIGCQVEGAWEAEPGYNWWDAWDLPSRDPAPSATGTPLAAATQDKQQDRGQELWVMDVQELKALVQTMQAGVLQPGCSNRAERQQQLRQARSVLSARLAGHGYAGGQGGGVHLHVSDVSGGADAQPAGPNTSWYSAAGGFLRGA